MKVLMIVISPLDLLLSGTVGRKKLCFIKHFILILALLELPTFETWLYWDSKTVPEIGTQKSIHPGENCLVYMKVIKALELDNNCFLALAR